MYANLRVTPAADAEVRPDAIAKRTLAQLGEDRSEHYRGVMYAYAVEVLPDGRIRAKLDGNDGGSYSEHAGNVSIVGGATISADF